MEEEEAELSPDPPLSLTGNLPEALGLTTQSVVSGPPGVAPELVRDAEPWAPPLPASITVCSLPRSPGDSSVHLRTSRFKLCKAPLENGSRAYINCLIKTVPITRFKSCLVSPKPAPKRDIVDVYCEN